jgi:hypothetical protein
MHWLLYAEYPVAPLRRIFGGAFMPNMEWRHNGEHSHQAAASTIPAEAAFALLNRAQYITLRRNFFDQIVKITDNALRDRPRAFETPRFIEAEQFTCPRDRPGIPASTTRRDV